MSLSPARPDAVWWHVYPLGACGAPIRGFGEEAAAPRLARLEPWLGYAAELGCTGLLLGPVFASSTHGYDTLDHFRLDPRLGGDEDWSRFADAARAHGLDLILDGVFNHVGARHALVAEAAAGRGMVRMEDGAHRGWEGHRELAELDHGDPRVADLVVDVMRRWLDRGAAGWRLDVAYAVPGPFWTEVIGRVKADHPDAVFLGEVIHGDYAAIAAAGSLDLITAYELWKAVWSSLVDRNMWELAWALERHAAFARGTRLQTFVGNHDVARIASLAGDDGAAIAAAVLLTLPGLPSIYYGDEQAFQGVKGEGAAADDPLRPELPATPADLAPEGRWLHALHRELIALRRANPWISDGELRVAGKTNGTIDYEVAGGGRTLRVRLELDPSPRVRATIDGDDAFGWGG